MLPLTTRQVPHNYHITTAQVRALVDVVSDGVYSVKEIMEKLELKNRSYFSKEYSKPAMEGLFIEPIYPEQLNHPKQKYRLTEKGKALLK